MPSALIAEDEPRLRARLRDLLGVVWPELTIAAEADDGEQALAALSRHAPDVLFLDIRMPGLTGIEVARAAAGRAHVVFITAYDEYAVAAFERGAVDYLLKPIDAPRLAETVRRLQERLAQPPADLRDLLAQLGARTNGRAPLRWIQASAANKLRFITVEEVLYFEADAKYVRVITRSGEATIRKPIRELADELDAERFWQIHRGIIVNIDAIDTVIRADDGRMEVRIKPTGSTLPVSESYRHRFRGM